MTDDIQTEAVESVEEREPAIDWPKAQEGVRLLLQAVGEDPDSAELQETWQRRVPNASETLTEGSRLNEKPELLTFEATGNSFVVKTGIPVYSLCEHHMLPFFGTATIAYRPNGEVVGLSKLSRYIRWQSRLLTMQEQLTQDIAHGLSDEIDARAVLVEISATHLCEAIRGIETKTETVTRAVAGEPTDDEQRQFDEASD